MGDQDHPLLQRSPGKKHAVDVLIETVRANPGIVLVTEDKAEHISARKVKAIDTAAAGDAFNGVLACATGNRSELAEGGTFSQPGWRFLLYPPGSPTFLAYPRAANRLRQSIKDTFRTFFRGLRVKLRAGPGPSGSDCTVEMIIARKLGIGSVFVHYQQQKIRSGKT